MKILRDREYKEMIELIQELIKDNTQLRIKDERNKRHKKRT